MSRATVVALILQASLLLPVLAFAQPDRGCISIGRVTAFTPRGEVYVEVKPTCTDADFAEEEPIVTHLEVLVSELPPVSRDVVVYRNGPFRDETYVFSGLDFESGDPILVRLIRFGKIQSLQSIKAP